MKTDIETSNDETNSDLLSDCRVMLRFATKNGLLLSEQLMRDVAELDMRLVSLDKEPIIFIDKKLIETDFYHRPTIALGQEQLPVEQPAVPAPLEAGRKTATRASSIDTGFPQSVPKDATSGDTSETTLSAALNDIQHPDDAAAKLSDGTEDNGNAGVTQTPIASEKKSPPLPDSASPNTSSFMAITQLVLRVQAELSLAISPATAVSLQTSEPPPGRHKLLGGMPLLVKWAAGAALGSALVFAITSAIIVASNSPKSTKPNGAVSSPGVLSAPNAQKSKTSLNAATTGLLLERVLWKF